MREPLYFFNSTKFKSLTNLDLLIRISFLSILAFISIIFGKPVYGTTDDNILSGLVSGSYTNENESKLIFIRPFVGFVMAFGQKIFPTFQFYSVFMLALVIVTFSIFGNILIKRSKVEFRNNILNLFWVGISAPTIIWFTLAPTYTATSIILTGLSTMTISLLIFDQKKTRIIVLITVSSIFSLGYLIRPEGALGTLALILVPLIYVFIQKRFINKGSLISVLLIVGSFISVDLGIQKLTNTESWQNYDNWNSVRHQIQHRVGQDSLLDSRESNKWTIPEYHLFMDLAFGDERIFNKSWITPAFESTKEYRGISGLLNANFIEVIRILLNILTNYYHIILIQLILLLLILKNVSTSIIQKISITLVSWAPVLAALYFTVATLHAPERSIYPILVLPSIIVVTLVIILGSKIKDARGSTIFYLIGTFIFLLLLFPDKGIINEIKTNEKNIESAIILSSELIKFDDQAIFIGHGNTEFYNFSNPYVNPAQWDSPKVITIGSWDTFSPHWYKRNQFVGIEQKSVYEALFTKDIYWLSNSLPDTSYMVELFLKENGFPETNRQNVAMFPEGQMLYKFLPQ
jgi:hypothetical protein